MFVLIHSPLVGSSSLRPTAHALQQRGLVCQVPSVFGSNVPRWCDWPERLLESVPAVEQPILVGHSAAGLLIARLASALSAAGLIFLDARIPPEDGLTAPAENEFLDFVRALPRQHGRLPPWSEWWGRDILRDVTIDPALKAPFQAELPRLPIDWFDDSFEMTSWSAYPAGYLQTSELFAEEASDAERRGWPVRRLEGTHLHPLLEPEETADALIAIARCLTELAGHGRQRP